MAKRKPKTVAKPRPTRGTLWLYTVPLKTPMGRPNGSRLYVLSHVEYSPATGRVNLRASTIQDWSGVQDADQMAAKLTADGWTVRYA